MPPRSLFSQIGKVDFFAVLFSGFFVFLVLYVSFGEVAVEKNSLWDSFEAISSEIKQQPALLLFIFFASYLLGSILRALPVHWVGYLIPRKVERMPYPSLVEELLKGLKEKSGAAFIDVGKLPDLSNGLSMAIFNYWKDELCLCNSKGFEYYQTFEARVRFFVAMFWAGVAGLVGGIALIFTRLDIIGIQLLLLSSIMVVAFGLNFRRVRTQEVRVLATIYAAWRQTSP